MPKFRKSILIASRLGLDPRLAPCFAGIDTASLYRSPIDIPAFHHSLSAGSDPDNRRGGLHDNPSIAVQRQPLNRSGRGFSPGGMP